MWSLEPNIPAIKGGQAAAMEWETVERRNRKKNEPAEKQPAKITPGTGARSPRKAPEGGLENVRRERDKLPPLPHTSRTLAVMITLKDRSGQSYAEVLAAAKDSVSLTEVDINAVKL